jgi:hypothetical protein
MIDGGLDRDEVLGGARDIAVGEPAGNAAYFDPWTRR